MNLAVIPARGGSKRIPHKNIRDFMGKPIIAYSIECAVKTNLFDKIIVSTDSNKIKEVALEYGAEVPFLRPEELSNDTAGITEVVAHAAQFYAENNNSADHICCMLATAPLMKATDIKKGYRKLIEENWDFVMSATDFAYPIFRAFQDMDKHGLKMFWPEMFEKRSQDLQIAYHDAAQFYWGKTSAWLNNQILFSENSSTIKLPRYRVCDIDEPEDWDIAEAIFQAQNS